MWRQICPVGVYEVSKTVIDRFQRQMITDVEEMHVLSHDFDGD